VDDLTKLGPLAGLVGTWKGDQGVDVAYQHAKGKIGETPYRERATFSAFGPVDNGTQCLYGLDYRMAAWRADEEDPFHTEVGYWLWDAAEGQVLRCFLVPRGAMVLAGGDATADATSFTLRATCGSEEYGILSSHYLAKQARTSEYSCTITIDGDTFSYESDTVVDVVAYGSTVHHTDRNTLKRVS
jgi:hypothetical protein